MEFLSKNKIVDFLKKSKFNKNLDQIVDFSLLYIRSSLFEEYDKLKKYLSEFLYNFSENIFNISYLKEQKDEITNRIYENLFNYTKNYKGLCFTYDGVLCYSYKTLTYVKIYHKISDDNKIPDLEYLFREELQILENIRNFKILSIEICDILCYFLEKFYFYEKEDPQLIFKILSYFYYNYIDYFIKYSYNKDEEKYLIYSFKGDLEKVKDLYNKVNYIFPHEVCLIKACEENHYVIVKFLFKKFEERFINNISSEDFYNFNFSSKIMDFLSEKLGFY